MKKSKIKNKQFTGRGPIARKVIKMFKVQMKNKITSLQDWKDGKESAIALQKSVISKEQLQTYDPLHAMYIDAQNQLSVLLELFVDLPMLHNLVRKHVEAEEKYMPSYPPMSPVTNSSFFCWSAFDLSTGGMKKESFCTIIIDYFKSIKVKEMQVEIFEHMQESYMGIYIHEGLDDDFVYLRELVTNSRIKAKVSTDYKGCEGEVWYVRILPPLFGLCDYSLVFTTPYILENKYSENIEQDWLDYFSRTLIVNENSKQSYQAFMKNGKNHNFWNEYITIAYTGYTSEFISLRGIPDLPESLPLSHLAQW